MALPPLQRFSVLSANDAARVVERIHSLRDHWKAFAPGRTIYRLGATHNAVQPDDEYRAEIDASRPVLQEHFGELLEKVRAALEPALQAIAPGTVVLDEQFGLPGFHLFLVDEQNRDPLTFHGGFHCDMLALDLDWQPPLPARMPLEHCISFTLSLALPPEGGGLLVCEGVTSRDVILHSEKRAIDPMDATDELARQNTPEFHPYAVGEMVMHSGQVVHAPAPWTTRPGDARITLQGHGFLIDGVWRLFW